MWTKYYLKQEGQNSDYFESDDGRGVWVKHERLCLDCIVSTVVIDNETDTICRIHDYGCSAVKVLIFKNYVDINEEWATLAVSRESRRQRQILQTVLRARAQGKVIKPHKQYSIKSLGGEIISGAELLEFMRNAIEYGDLDATREAADDRASM